MKSWIKNLRKSAERRGRKTTCFSLLFFYQVNKNTKFLYQLRAVESDDWLVDGGSCGIIPGGAGIGIGFIISSMLNFGITFRSWLWPWWLKPPACECECPEDCWMGKDFGNCDFDPSELRAFHLSFKAFKAIARRLSVSCWSDDSVVRGRRSLVLLELRGMIGWCFTIPRLRLIL